MCAHICSFYLLSYEVNMCLCWFNIWGLGRMYKPVTSTYCIQKCRALERSEIENICVQFGICQSAQLYCWEVWFEIMPWSWTLPLFALTHVRHNGQQSLLFLPSFYDTESGSAWISELSSFVFWKHLACFHGSIT